MSFADLSVLWPNAVDLWSQHSCPRGPVDGLDLLLPSDTLAACTNTQGSQRSYVHAAHMGIAYYMLTLSL